MQNDHSEVPNKKKSWTLGEKSPQQHDKKAKLEKFNFASMKTAATHADLNIRTKAFIEYYERFKEFPSFLFDNTYKIDDQLAETVKVLVSDKSTSAEMLKDILALLRRLPS